MALLVAQKCSNHIGRGICAPLVASIIALLAVLLIGGCSGGGGGGGGSSNSGPAAVAVPLIVAQPQSLRVSDGQAASFSVTVVSSASSAYQWSRNGVAIAGATASTYTIAATQLSDNGAALTVAVTNSNGSTQSATATLNVAPVAPGIVNNVPATVSVLEGQPATFSVTANGSLPLTFQWRRGGGVIAGATNSTYTIPATLLSDNGATFDVVVTNTAGTATSALFTVNVTARTVAPSIVTAPRSQTINAGSPVTITVVAAGTVPFTYQWLRGGTAITGAQSSSYTLASATLGGDNGAQFSVVVGNAAGSITSTAATLTVAPAPGLAVIAGSFGGPGTIDAVGTAARFLSPSAVAIDNANNLYVADGSLLRKIDTSGSVTTFAGSATAAGTTDGTGAAARFRVPAGAAVDAAGNLFVSDIVATTIRRVTPAGVVTTFAGTGDSPGSSDGTGASASFRNPVGIAFDAAGNLYVADSGNNTIRKITASGVVTTFAGTPGVAGAADGVGGAAQFRAPRGVAVDASGNVYVADTGNHTIRVVSPAGAVRTVAGTAGVAGAADGTGAAASFASPSGITIDGSGVIYIGEIGNLTVRRLTPAGVVTTFAGAPTVAGSTDGTGAAARFLLPLSLASDASGVLYVADRDNASVRKVSTTAVVSTFVGSATVQGSSDGTGLAASFSDPYGVAVDSAGNVYVSDYFNATLRRIAPSGVTTTLAGLAGVTGSADGSGSAARFATPQGIAIDGAGTLYVADKTNQTIRKVTPGGVVTTLAGSPGVRGSVDGTGAAASFNNPSAVAVDAAGNIYVVDAAPTVRKITPAGVVTTLAGAAGRVGAVDGAGAIASFNFPGGVAVDAAGNVYVADSRNSLVRKITSAGVVSTVAGIAGTRGTNDGPATTALFDLPTGITISGTALYVSDINGHTIRKIDGAGNVTTVAGTPDNLRGVRVGTLPGHLDLPIQLAIDAAGIVYATDANAVLRLTLP